MVLASYAGVFLSLESVPCMMVHISDDGLSCQTQEGEQECHYNGIQGYFNPHWLLLSLKQSNLLHRFCSGGNGAHHCFLPLSTSLPSLQQFLDSLSSVLVWFIILRAKMTSFTFSHWGFYSKWHLPCFFLFYSSSAEWQQCAALLIHATMASKNWPLSLEL